MSDEEEEVEEVTEGDVEEDQEVNESTRLIACACYKSSLNYELSNSLQIIL